LANVTTFGEFYNTGTVALTINSTAVVGAGLVWSDIEQGDILECLGRQATIDSVSGGGLDHITLMNPWVGPSTSSSTVTITIASPGVVSWTAHGLAADTPVKITTTGALPTGLVAGTIYYVKSPATNTFQLAATPGGSAINTSGSQSGTHTASNGVYVIRKDAKARFDPALTQAKLREFIAIFDDTLDISAGAFNVIGDFSVSTDKFTVDGGTGAAVLAGTLDIAPAAGGVAGLKVNITGPFTGISSVGSLGSDNGALNYNHIYVNEDAVIGSPNAYATALGVTMQVGGTNRDGSRAAIFGLIHVNAAEAGTAGVAGDHVAIVAGAGAFVNDGGTNTGAGARGTLFGSSHGATLFSGATNYLVASGAEVDVGINTGASAKYRLGWSIVGTGNVQGASLDGGLEISSAGQPWQVPVLFTNIHGGPPVTLTGSLLGTDGSAVTCANFASFPTYTFSGNIFNFANFQVTGAGAVTSSALTTGVVNIVNNPASTPFFDAHTSTITIANGANAAIYDTIGLILITDQTVIGDTAVWITNGVSLATLVSSTGTSWVASTTSPAAGKASLAYSGGSLKIYNNLGGSSNFGVMSFATR
jgi:hypothetical protein